jgi:hypothetical protein
MKMHLIYFPTGYEIWTRWKIFQYWNYWFIRLAALPYNIRGASICGYICSNPLHTDKKVYKEIQKGLGVNMRKGREIYEEMREYIRRPLVI